MKSEQMDYLFILLIIFIVLLIILIIYNSYLYVAWVNPENYPKVRGEFAVQVNKKSTVKNVCGENGKDVCTFKNIRTLSEAIGKCNEFHELCTNFTYSEFDNVLNFVNIDSESGIENIYLRQI